MQSEAQREHDRKYYLGNKSKKLEANRRWHLANPEKVKEDQRKWRLKNKSKVTEYNRRWRAANPEIARERARKWVSNNAERNRQHKRRYAGYPEPTRLCPEFCECCGGPPGGRGSLHLDHCHETGVFRGWLCHSCNIGLGNFGDNIDGLKKAIAYLERVDSTLEKGD